MNEGPLSPSTTTPPDSEEDLLSPDSSVSPGAEGGPFSPLTSSPTDTTQEQSSSGSAGTPERDFKQSSGSSGGRSFSEHWEAVGSPSGISSPFGSYESFSTQGKGYFYDKEERSYGAKVDEEDDAVDGVELEPQREGVVRGGGDGGKEQGEKMEETNEVKGDKLQDFEEDDMEEELRGGGGGGQREDDLSSGSDKPDDPRSESPRSSSPSVLSASNFSVSTFRLDRVGLSDDEPDSDGDEVSFPGGVPSSRSQMINDDPGLISDEDRDTNSDPGVNSSNDESEALEANPFFDNDSQGGAQEGFNSFIENSGNINPEYDSESEGSNLPIDTNIDSESPNWTYPDSGNNCSNLGGIIDHPEDTGAHIAGDRQNVCTVDGNVDIIGGAVPPANEQHHSPSVGQGIYFETDLDDEDGAILEEVTYDSLTSGPNFFLTETPRTSRMESTCDVHNLREDLSSVDEPVLSGEEPNSEHHSASMDYSGDHGNNMDEEAGCVTVEHGHNSVEIEHAAASNPQLDPNPDPQVLGGDDLVFQAESLASASTQGHGSQINYLEEQNYPDTETGLPFVRYKEGNCSANQEENVDSTGKAEENISVDTDMDLKSTGNIEDNISPAFDIENRMRHMRSTQQGVRHSNIVESHIMSNLGFFETETNFGCTSFDSDDSDIVSAIYRDTGTYYDDRSLGAQGDTPGGFPAEFRMYKDLTQMEEDYFSGVHGPGDIGEDSSSIEDENEWGLSPLTEEDEEEEEEEVEEIKGKKEYENNEIKNVDNKLATADGEEGCEANASTSENENIDRGAINSSGVSENSHNVDTNIKKKSLENKICDAPPSGDSDRLNLLMEALRSEVQSTSGEVQTTKETFGNDNKISDMSSIDPQKLSSLDLSSGFDLKWEIDESSSSDDSPVINVQEGSKDTTEEDVYVDYKPRFFTQYSTELPREASKAISERVKDALDVTDDSNNGGRFSDFENAVDLSCSRSFVELKSQKGMNYDSDSDSSLSSEFDADSLGSKGNSSSSSSSSKSRSLNTVPKLSLPAEEGHVNESDQKRKTLHRMETIESSPRAKEAGGQNSFEEEEVQDEESLMTADDSSVSESKPKDQQKRGKESETGEAGDATDDFSDDWASSSSTDSSDSSDSGHMEIFTARRCDTIPEESGSEQASPVDYKKDAGLADSVNDQDNGEVIVKGGSLEKGETMVVGHLFDSNNEVQTKRIENETDSFSAHTEDNPSDSRNNDSSMQECECETSFHSENSRKDVMAKRTADRSSVPEILNVEGILDKDTSKYDEYEDEKEMTCEQDLKDDNESAVSHCSDTNSVDSLQSGSESSEKPSMEKDVDIYFDDALAMRRRLYKEQVASHGNTPIALSLEGILGRKVRDWTPPSMGDISPPGRPEDEPCIASEQSTTQKPMENDNLVPQLLVAQQHDLPEFQGIENSHKQPELQLIENEGQKQLKEIGEKQQQQQQQKQQQQYQQQKLKLEGKFDEQNEQHWEQNYKHGYPQNETLQHDPESKPWTEYPEHSDNVYRANQARQEQLRDQQYSYLLKEDKRKLEERLQISLDYQQSATSQDQQERQPWGEQIYHRFQKPRQEHQWNPHLEYQQVVPDEQRWENLAHGWEQQDLLKGQQYEQNVQQLEEEQWTLQEQKEKEELLKQLQQQELQEYGDESHQQWEPEVQEEFLKLQKEQQKETDQKQIFQEEHQENQQKLLEYQQETGPKHEEHGEHQWAPIIQEKQWKISQNQRENETSEQSVPKMSDLHTRQNTKLAEEEIEQNDNVMSLRELMKRKQHNKKILAQCHLFKEKTPGDTIDNMETDSKHQGEKDVGRYIRKPDDQSDIRDLSNIFWNRDSRRYIHGHHPRPNSERDNMAKTAWQESAEESQHPSKQENVKNISHIQFKVKYKIPHEQSEEKDILEITDGNGEDTNSETNIVQYTGSSQDYSDTFPRDSKDFLDLEKMAMGRCDEISSIFLQNFHRIPKMVIKQERTRGENHEIRFDESFQNSLKMIEDVPGEQSPLGEPLKQTLKLSSENISEPDQISLRDANSSIDIQNIVSDNSVTSLEYHDKVSVDSSQKVQQYLDENPFTSRNYLEDDDEEEDVFVSLPRRTLELNRINRDSNFRSSPFIRQDTPRSRSRAGMIRHMPKFMDVEEEVDSEVQRIESTESQSLGASTSQDTSRQVPSEGHERDSFRDVITPIVTSPEEFNALTSAVPDQKGDKPVDDMSLEAEGIRHSRHLENLVRQQIQDPDTKNNIVQNRSDEDERKYSDIDRGSGHRSSSGGLQDHSERDVDDRGRERSSSDRYGRYSTSPSRTYDRSKSPYRSNRDNSDGYERSVSPSRAYDRSSSPSRIYDRPSSPTRYDRSVSPTRGYDRSASPPRKSYERSSSPSREYNRSVSPSRQRESHEDRPSSTSKPYERSNSSERNYHDREFQPIHHGSDSTERLSRAQTLNSGRQSTSSEQEMSRYFNNNDSSKRGSGDYSQKPRLESGRRSVDRLSEIMRRSNDRLADFDKVLDDRNPPQSGRYSSNDGMDNGEQNQGSYRDYSRDTSSYSNKSPYDRDRDTERPIGRDSRSSRVNSADLDSHNNHMSPNDFVSPEKRSSASEVSATPTQPTLRQALVTTRTTPLSTSRSAARQPRSSGNRDDAYRVQDLEDTISSLKRCLRERENEVDDLKSQMRSLQSELHQAKNSEVGFDKGHFEKKIDNLIAERENLATEVWRLRKELDNRRSERSSSPTRGDTQPDMTRTPGPGSLDSFDPNNPRALQRKIVELEAQLQDQQEVNESASGKLAMLEKQVLELQDENQMLQRNSDDCGRDIREENALLKEQLESLRTEPMEGDNEYFRWEVRQLREELHLLRDRNHQLAQDNIRLSEHVRDLDDKRGLYKSLPSENGVMEKVDSYRREGENHREDSRYSRSSTPSRHHTNLDLPSSHTSLSRTSRTSDGEQNGRAPSEKSDSTMYLTSAPFSGMNMDENLGKGLKDKDIKTVSSGLKEINQFKQDMIDDVIDEVSPTAKSGLFNSSVPKPNVRGINKSTLLPPIKQDIDIHIMNGKTETSVEDIDDDEFFLGPGKQTYKVSSSITGQRLTEPFTTSSSSTYTAPEDLPITSTSVKRQSDTLHQNGTYLSTKTNGTFMKSLQQELDDLSDSDDLDVKRSLQNGHSGDSGFPTTPRLSERRDSVGSDSTDYILNQAEQHLKHSHTGDNNNILDDSQSTMETHIQGGTTSIPSSIHQSAPRHRSLSPNPGLTSHGLSNLNSGLSGLNTYPLPRSVSATPNCSSRPIHQHHLSSDPVISCPSSPHPTASPSLSTHYTQARSPSPNPLGSQHIHDPVYTSPRTDQNLKHVSGRPFVPRSAGDITVDDYVKFTRQGGKISKGIIKYIGHLPGKNDTYLGIELEQELGKHDGIYDGQRYFTCKPNRGVFVAFSRVVMAWTGS